MSVDTELLIQNLLYYVIMIILLPLWLPFYILISLKSIIKYKKDIDKNGYTFLFKRYNNLFYYEIHNKKIRKAIIGEYFHGKEPYISLIKKHKWNGEVVEWLKDRREELIHKLLSEFDDSYYEHIS